MARRTAQNRDNGRLATQQSVNAAIKSICDIMRRFAGGEELAAIVPPLPKGREVAAAVAALRAMQTTRADR